jgi:hypothetical protein
MQIKLKFSTALLWFLYFLTPWRDTNPDRMFFRRMRWPLTIPPDGSF